jgi:hypothetical protein
VQIRRHERFIILCRQAAKVERKVVSLRGSHSERVELVRRVEKVGRGTVEERERERERERAVRMSGNFGPAMGLNSEWDPYCC